MNIWILNTLGTGQDLINLLKHRIRISGVIGLSDRTPTDSISDFVYLKDFCKDQGLPFVEVDSYGLSKESDKEKLLKLNIDVLVVSGWQRLIPNWLIDHTKVAAIGAHGSPMGITAGRGRSPQNWALMLGLTEFHLSIFKVAAGADNGLVIDTRTFNYSPYDDIKTSYYKVTLLCSEMISELVNSGRLLKQSFQVQDESQAAYFPQRLPEDGYLDWELSSEEVGRFVRSLTRPYPGARTRFLNEDLVVWSGMPFSIPTSQKHKPGTVFSIFRTGDLIVSTGDGFYLITDYESKHSVKVGSVFESHPFKQQLEKIVKRHLDKFPEHPVTYAITKKISSSTHE